LAQTPPCRCKTQLTDGWLELGFFWLSNLRPYHQADEKYRTLYELLATCLHVDLLGLEPDNGRIIMGWPTDLIKASLSEKQALRDEWIQADEFRQPTMFLP